MLHVLSTFYIQVYLLWNFIVYPVHLLNIIHVFVISRRTSGRKLIINLQISAECMKTTCNKVAVGKYHFFEITFITLLHGFDLL